MALGLRLEVVYVERLRNRKRKVSGQTKEYRNRLRSYRGRGR